MSDHEAPRTAAPTTGAPTTGAGTNDAPADRSLERVDDAPEPNAQVRHIAELEDAWRRTAAARRSANAPMFHSREMAGAGVR